MLVDSFKDKINQILQSTQAAAQATQVKPSNAALKPKEDAVTLRLSTAMPVPAMESEESKESQPEKQEENKITTPGEGGGAISGSLNTIA